MTETKSYVLLQQGEKVEIMSLRDYFAAKALPVVYIPPSIGGEDIRQHAEKWGAIYAYKMADAMLKARESK